MGAAAAVWARVLLPQVLGAPLPARPGAPAPAAVHKLGAAGAVTALKCAHCLSALLLLRHEAADAKIDTGLHVYLLRLCGGMGRPVARAAAL